MNSTCWPGCPCAPGDSGQQEKEVKAAPTSCETIRSLLTETRWHCHAGGFVTHINMARFYSRCCWNIQPLAFSVCTPQLPVPKAHRTSPVLSRDCHVCICSRANSEPFSTTLLAESGAAAPPKAQNIPLPSHSGRWDTGSPSQPLLGHGATLPQHLQALTTIFWLKPQEPLSPEITSGL